MMGEYQRIDYPVIGFGILRVSDGRIIHPDNGSKDARLYALWLEEGNEPDADPNLAIDAVMVRKIRDLRFEATRRILAKWTDVDQRNIDGGRYDNSILDINGRDLKSAMDFDINTIRAEYQSAKVVILSLDSDLLSEYNVISDPGWTEIGERP